MGAPIGSRLAAKLPAWRRPLPFQFESTGEVSQFTNWMEPHARSRDIFSFHRPETLLEMAQDETTMRGCLREMPEVPLAGLWPKQHTAIVNVEKSLRLAKPRVLVDIMRLEGLRNITSSPGSIAVGAAVRQAELLEWPSLDRELKLV